MWPTLRKAGAPLALVGLCLVTLARSLPLTDAGPHVNYGWGEAIRLRHLYTAGRHSTFSYFLRINSDGRVDGASAQNLHSLLEIRAVSVRTVAIKGVESSRYLCMEAEGRLRGLLSYSTEDCSFEEEMRPDGYNIYKSKKYGVLVSLSTARQRQQNKGKDFPLSHFLPMINTVPVESTDFGDYGDTGQHLQSGVFSPPLETDSMDPFGITSEVSVKSLSFGK
ncbi:fibroblast growth factor 19 [Lacerta agilis]|uniref:fibroblast growth factor 19 n=1 Tax=Lacerta agilis TaxID=80427 RepID=UPI00141A06D4|nr:fibroblast growth factor 19 [Lacerta agilis]